MMNHLRSFRSLLSLMSLALNGKHCAFVNPAAGKSVVTQGIPESVNHFVGVPFYGLGTC